uniref:ORF3 n=1 Tax=Nitrosopumilaceae spindle-shaped virus TaxID=3065433 RepID=A0AAT9JAE0_9VIRU
MLWQDFVRHQSEAINENRFFSNSFIVFILYILYEFKSNNNDGPTKRQKNKKQTGGHYQKDRQVILLLSVH